MPKPNLRLATIMLFGAWISLLAGCSDSLPTSLTPSPEPSFLTVGKCQVINHNYAGGTVTPNWVAELRDGVLLRVCCLGVGTATVTAPGMKALPIKCTPAPACTCGCTGLSLAPPQSTHLVAPKTIRIPQLGSGTPDFACEHDQGGG
jgi:hypothetical protein